MTFSSFSFSEAPFSGSLNSYSLTCEAGSYTLNGQSASFAYVKTLPASAGSYAITGNAAGLTNDKVLQGNAGSYTFTGNDAGLDYNQLLNCEVGSFALTGNSATFLYNQTIYAGAFSFILSGQQAQLLKASKTNGNAGSYTISGGSATFQYERVLSGNAGSYLYIGNAATLQYNHNVIVIESKGGLPKKKRKSKIDVDREQREELEAIVKREFDILDGTYVPETVEMVKEVFIPKIKQIDLNEYNLAIAQVNALLLQAKIQAAEYEAELDDEEALLMLL